MLLNESFDNVGRWLFKWRSFLPLLTVGLFLTALRRFSYPAGSHHLDLLWESISFGVALLGLVIRIITVGNIPRGTSGRTTDTPKAAVLNTTAMYSIIRHPLYLGNFFIWLGISMLPRSLFFSLSAILLFFLYYERIISAEEKFLLEKSGQDFMKWANVTPMIMPRFKNWRKSEIPFSWKTVFKREYTGFFAIITTFTCLEISGDLFYLGKWQFDLEWIVVFLVGLITYILLLTLKKIGLLNNKG